MKPFLLLALCLALPLALAADDGDPLGDVPDINGLWHYGVDRNPDWCVRVSSAGDRYNIEFLIRDGEGGGEWVYARAVGAFASFHEFHVKGAYVENHQHNKKGDKFRARWLLYDEGKKAQELSYWGVHLVVNYLVR